MSRVTSRGYWAPLLVAMVVLGAYFIPLPYFISKPGEAVELAPIISVEDRYEEQGTFMLTTVRMAGSNLFSYAFAHWNSYMEIIPKEVLLAHYKDEREYSDRQLQIMESSQESAILVAYRLADKTVITHNEGVIVVQTLEDMPGERYLRVGDMITHIDGRAMETSDELVSYIHTKQLGESVSITYKRNNEVQEVSVELAPFPFTDEEQEQVNALPRAGIGISTLTKRSIEVDPKVKINTQRIGGPSAGLMFALEIYNQLTEQDITKGYRIAGTGTIDTNGTVGRIGGVHQKVVAADRARADIFFAPNEQGKANSNYLVAQETAEDIKSTMKIVPIDTIQDALDYLANLPDNQS